MESDYFPGIELQLTRVGESADGFTALLFEGDKNMDTVKYLRQVSGRLHLGSYTGFSIPDEAIFYQGAEPFVQLKSLGETENIPITVLFDGDGFKIAKSPLLFEGSALIINSGGKLP